MSGKAEYGAVLRKWAVYEQPLCAVKQSQFSLSSVILSERAGAGD